MRSLFYLVLTILIILLAYFLYDQCSEAYYATDATVIIDRTEKDFLATPDAEALKKLFPVKENIWKGYRFRILELTDIDFNPSFTVALKPRCQYLSNSYEREDEVNTFLGSINEAFKRILDSPAGKPRSSVYVPLAAELTRLAQDTANRKVLVVYSDLMENTSLLSLYKAAHLKLLQENPDSVKQVLEISGMLPDLTGIEIFFVYQPVNNNENEVFRAISGFFKEWLESKGARVNIGADF